jgi:hypothetical protein
MAETDRLLPLDDGPWVGMVDSVAPTSKKEGRYLLGQNIYPLDPAIGDGVVGRPGVRVMGAIGGSVGHRRVQGHYQFTRKDGVEFTIRVVGGKFQTLDWATETWTEIVTTAELTAAAITIDPDVAQVAFLTFTNKVLINDQVNTPWMWDGTAHGGLTKLTNAPAFFGQPTVYSGRLMGIKVSDPVTFVWSEADTPNTGYEAGGFNNSWSLTQTDSNRLYRLLGTNDELKVFRARSATAVTGTVTSNFASSATRDSLSETEGTTSPFAVVLRDVDAMFIDADMHPQYLRPGAQGATPLWNAYRESLRRVPRTPALAQKAFAILYSPASLLLYAICDVGATEPNLCLVFDVKGTDPVPVGLWRGWEITSMAMVKNAVGAPYWLHGDSAGYTYLHGNPEDNIWNDALVTGTLPVHHILRLQALGFSVKREKFFDRIDMSFRALSKMTLNVSTFSSRGQSPPQQVVVQSQVPGFDNSLWDQTFQFDPDVSLITQESHGDVGIDVEARWIEPYIDHNTIDEQFGMIAVSVDAYMFDDDPEVP